MKQEIHEKMFAGERGAFARRNYRCVCPRELWVFGYGSLMWRPGFPFDEVVRARLRGWRRAFCIYSIYHRGSRQRPGLVLGLDRGGACEGLAFRVPARHAAETLAYLRWREQVTAVYREAHLPVTLQDGCSREILALAFLVERAHPAYAGHLPLRDQARLIRSARGRSGTNLDYLLNTLAHFSQLNIRERDMERLLGLIGPFAASGRTNGALYSARVRSLTACCTRQPLPAPRFRPEEYHRFAYRTRLSRGL